MAKKEAKSDAAADAAINPVETLSIEVKDLRARCTRLEDENAKLRLDADTLQASLRRANQAAEDAEARAREAPAAAVKALGGELLIAMQTDRRIGPLHLTRGTVVGVLRLQHGVGVDFLADGLRNGVLAPEPVTVPAPVAILTGTQTPPPPPVPTPEGDQKTPESGESNPAV